MQEDKAVISSKDAMSRALGAAFLSHQVEQLEKTVYTNPSHHGPSYSRRGNDGNRGRGTTKRNGGSTRGRGMRRGSDVEAQDEAHTREEEKSSGGEDKDEKKDADLVVVDASVLVHAIGQVKKWCRQGREEIIVVPLEALNTLDLLKKGTTLLAQRARAASRILEQQVGTNPRIKVQRDDAFVLWDEIPFQGEGSSGDEAPEAKSPQATPEWLRRTICCARWEFEHASIPETEDEVPANVPHILIAVSPSPLEVPQVPTETPALSTSPIPLPAPFPNKYEPRASGNLVAEWAKKAGLEVLDVKPTPLPSPTTSNPGGTGRPRSAAGRGRGSSDDEWRVGPGGGARVKGGSMGRKNVYTNGGHGHTGEKVNIYGSRPTVTGRSGGDKLVERPAATMAMNASIMQPNKVVRVLARGEKLEP